MKSIASSSTLSHGLRLLELLQQADDGLSSVDIQSHLQLSNSSLFALLAELKRLGYIRQPERRGKYYAGLRMQFLNATSVTGPHALIAAFEKAESHALDAYTLLLVSALGANWLVHAARAGSARVRVAFEPGELLPAEGAGDLLFSDNPDPALVERGYLSVAYPDFSALAVPVTTSASSQSFALLLLEPRANSEQPDSVELGSALKLLAANVSLLAGARAYAPFERGSTALPLKQLSAEEIADFLKLPLTARLACVRPDGTPHVIPVWQQWDGKRFAVPVIPGSQWVEHTRSNPAVSLTIDEHWYPYRRVIARGQVTGEAAAGSAAFERALRYFAEAYPAVIDQSDGLKIGRLVYITPDNLIGQTGL